MKMRPLLPLTLLFCSLAVLLPRPVASAQSVDAPSPGHSDRTASGRFESSDGTSGTFTESYSLADDVATDTVVCALADSTTTRTETMTTTTHSDGTKTVVFSELGFAATVPFTSTATYTASKGGSAVGTGVYSTPDGSTGVLAAVVARNGQTSITSTDFTSMAGVLTRQIRLEEKSQGDTVKTLDVDAGGTLTITTIARFGGMHHQHP